MDNYERIFDLTHVFNYVKYNLKKIIIITLIFSSISIGIITSINVKAHCEELYYSTAKILFRYDSLSTGEKYNVSKPENLNDTEIQCKDNLSFLQNSKYIFFSDKILMQTIDEFNIETDLSDFKKTIIVDNIPSSDIVRIIVTANTSKQAEGILNSIISSGVEAVENLYQLKCEIIDQYTYSDKPFSKLTVNNDVIEVSFDDYFNIKDAIIIFGLFLALSIIYFVLKCLLNDKVESVDQIENEFNVPVLQAMSMKKNYDLTITKLINNDDKKIIFTNIGNKESVSEEILSISKGLLDKNKKVLIVCVNCKGCYKALGCDLKNEITVSDGIELMYTNINSVEIVVDKYQNNYDYILIETESIYNQSDALYMAKMFDATVLVVKCNTVSYSDFKRYVEDFEKYGHGLTGIILKDVTKDSSSYKYVR